MADVLDEVKGKVIYAEDLLDLFYVASAGQDKAFIDIVEDVVINTPTADVAEVKHGEWLVVLNCGAKCIGRCSLCGVEQEAPHYTALISGYRYCHYCGAKMDGIDINVRSNGGNAE